MNKARAWVQLKISIVPTKSILNELFEILTQGGEIYPFCKNVIFFELGAQIKSYVTQKKSSGKEKKFNSLHLLPKFDL